MAHQLIYTSYPISLTHGRTGFSTVARSADMPERFASALERFSVYEAAKGAVYSHRIFAFGGKTWHILSRICDCGADYTNRNNFIAHHLAVSEDEAEKLANPAEILAHWNGWKSAWNEDPRYLEDVDLSYIKAEARLPAQEWAETFGDSGKAALLGGEPAFITAPISAAQTVLRLFSESLLLNINAADAWRISLTTCFFAADNPSDFKWKCAPSFAPDSARGVMINLETRTAPTAPETRAAQYARDGEMNNREKYNLKVSGPKVYERKFEVVETSKNFSFPFFSFIIISVGVAVAALLCFAIFLFYETSPAEPAEEGVLLTESAVAAEPQGTTSLADAKPRPKLYEVLDSVKLRIEDGEFKKALEEWDSSAYAAREPEYRKEILADIANRIDFILRSADGVLEGDGFAGKEMSAALANVAAARRGLDILELPDRSARLKKWEAVNGKIKKQ